MDQNSFNIPLASLNQNRESLRVSLEEEFISALDSGDIEISREELMGGDFVACLKEKLARGQ